MRLPRRNRRTERRAWRLSTLVAATVFLSAGVALAWTIGTTNPGNSVTASSLGSPGTPGVTIVAGACTSIDVTWAVASGANRYRVEASTTGTWTTLASSHTTTAYTDNTPYTNVTVTYRITPLLSGTNWEGPSTTGSVTCGVGSVSDLAATHGCSSTALTWSAATNATRYEIWVQVNGGAATSLTTNHTLTTYTDSATYPANATVAYQVRPRNGGTIGNYSNTSTVTGWNTFRVSNVAFSGAGGLPVALDAGDQVVVTFTKPVKTGTVTSTNVVASNAGGTRGLFLAASAAGDGNTDIGSWGTANGYVNTGGTYGGTTAWNVDRTVWTWTATSAQSNVMDDIPSTGWSLGSSATRALCAGDGTTQLAATAPSVGGSW